MAGRFGGLSGVESYNERPKLPSFVDKYEKQNEKTYILGSTMFGKQHKAPVRKDQPKYMKNTCSGPEWYKEVAAFAPPCSLISKSVSFLERAYRPGVAPPA